MTLTDCQLLSIVAQLGTFAAAAERMHITLPPSATRCPAWRPSAAFRCSPAPKAASP